MNNPNPDLPGQGILVYEIELVSVKPTEEATKKECGLHAVNIEP